MASRTSSWLGAAPGSWPGPKLCSFHDGQRCRRSIQSSSSSLSSISGPRKSTLTCQPLLLLIFISISLITASEGSVDAGKSRLMDLHNNHEDMDKQQLKRGETAAVNIGEAEGAGEDYVFPPIKSSSRNKHDHAASGDDHALVNSRLVSNKELKAFNGEFENGCYHSLSNENYYEYIDLLVSTKSEYDLGLNMTKYILGEGRDDETDSYKAVVTLDYPTKTKKSHKYYKNTCSLIGGTFMRLGDDFSFSCMYNIDSDVDKNVGEETKQQVLVGIKNYAYCLVDEPATKPEDCRNKISIQETIQEDIFDRYEFDDCTKIKSSKSTQSASVFNPEKYQLHGDGKHNTVVVSNTNHTKNITITKGKMTEAQQKEAEQGVKKQLKDGNGQPGDDGAMDEKGVHHYNAADHKVTGKEKQSIGKGGAQSGVVGGGDGIHYYNAADYKVDKSKVKEKDQQSTKQSIQNEDGDSYTAMLVILFVAVSTLLCSAASGIILRKLYQICTGRDFESNDELGKYSKVATNTYASDEEDSSLEMADYATKKHRLVDDEYGDVGDEDGQEEEEKKEDDKTFDV